MAMYVYRLPLYTGKKMETSQSEIGLCSRVVFNISAGLEHLVLDVYTDNYYTSLALYHKL